MSHAMIEKHEIFGLAIKIINRFYGFDIWDTDLSVGRVSSYEQEGFGAHKPSNS
jgi:hypothetical protein